MKKMLSVVAFLATCAASFAAIPDGGWSVTPKPGSTVTKITEITVSKSNEYYMDPYINRTVKINGEAIAVTQKASSSGGTITMTLATPVEKSGEYEIVVPARMFTYGFYEDDNPEMSWSVTVDNPDSPVTPDIPDVTAVANPQDKSTVKELGQIEITYEGAATATVGTDASATVTSGGKTVDSAVSFGAGPQPNSVLLTLSPALTTSGEYTVTVAAGAVNLTAESGTEFASAELKLNYTVKAPLAVGDKFVVDKIRYKVLSREPLTAAVTWPEDEADYAALTTIPTTAEYEGEVFAVTEIGDLAFSEVRAISEFTVPEGITRIGEGAFWQSSLSKINLPASVTELADDVFDECQSLTEFDLPTTVTAVGNSLLSGCVALKSVTLHEGLTAIPDNFVQGCTKLAALQVPATVTKIGEFAMSECTALATTNIPEGVTSLGRFAYAYCLELKSLPVPESVAEMGHGVFYQAGLTEASLPENITVIPDGTYQCCTALSEFTVGNNVTEIEQEAFYWCFGLAKITFGEKVSIIGAKAFTGDKAITEVVSLNPVPPTGAAFEQEVYTGASLTVPEGAAEAYRAADGWKEFVDINGSAAVKAIEAAEAFSAAVEGDELVITAPAGATVTVTSAQGRTLYTGPAGRVAIGSRGVYLVSCAGHTEKVCR